MKKILLIDDSLIQHRLMKNMLKDRYELLTCTSGVEGIRLARTESPDLILLDYNMPILSGKETLRRLHEKEETREIPVVFLTGVNEKRDVGAVLKLRPQGYLLKPVEPVGLLQVIDKVLSGEKPVPAEQEASGEEVLETIYDNEQYMAAQDELLGMVNQILDDGSLFYNETESDAESLPKAGLEPDAESWPEIDLGVDIGSWAEIDLGADIGIRTKEE